MSEGATTYHKLRKRGTRHSSILNAIAPFWDGNETWLVLIGAGLFAAFPMVYAIFLPAFYLPITLMLFGLIFRGAARRCRDFRNSGRICIFGGQIFVQSPGGAWGRSRGVRIFASAHEVLGEKP